MSEALKLIADVKAIVADVERDIVAFEKEIAHIGHFTDLAHLNIARIHLGELRSSLACRRADVASPGPAPEAEAAPEPVVEDVTVDEPPAPEPAKARGQGKTRSQRI